MTNAVPSLLKDSTITLITRGLLFIIVMFSSIIISRVLGPFEKGSYNIAILVLSVTSMVVLFGLGSANVYYGASDPDKLPALVGNSIIAAICFGCLGIVIIEFAVTQPFFQEYLVKNGVEINWIRWLVIFLPLSLLTAYMREIVRATGQIVRYNFIYLGFASVNFLSLVILVWIFNQGLNGALATWVIAQIVVAVLSIWMALQAVSWRLAVDWPIFYQSFTFGIRLYPGNIAQFLNYRLDVFLVGFFLTPIEVGIYTLATVLAEKLWEFPEAIRIVLLHHVAKEADTQAANIRTMRVSRIVFLSMGVICLITTLASYPLIRLLYGLDYLAAAPALILLLPGIWVLSIGKLLAVHLSGLGRPEIGTYSAAISLITTLGFDLVLIPKLGIMGASIASSVSYIIATIVIVKFFLKITNLNLLDIALVHRDDLLFLYRIITETLFKRFLRLSVPGEN